MKIVAWHCIHTYFREAQFTKNTKPFHFNKTHFAVPTSFKVEEEDKSKEELLGAAFSFFNWVDNDFGAPTVVNEMAKFNGTHASMSVGDIIELVDTKEFYMVDPVGWTKIIENNTII